VRFFISSGSLANRGSQPILSGLLEPCTFEWSRVLSNGAVYFSMELCTFRWNCVLFDGTVYLNGAGDGAVYLVRPGRESLPPEYSFL
jgi:hypothetical protein